MNSSAKPPVRRRRRRNYAALLLGIWVAVFLVFILLPMVAVVAVSFSSASFIAFPIPGLSLRWYARAFEYGPFMQSLLVSIELALASAAIGGILGIPAALAIGRSRSAFAGGVSNFLLTPLSMPAIVLGFSLLYYLSALHIESGFPALLIAHSIIAIPYVARTTLSVYRSVPVTHEEAAAVLGAGRAGILRHVILPQVAPGIFTGATFAVLISFDNLPLSYFFGNAHTATLPVVMLSYLENQFDPSIAAISVIQMMIALLALVIIHWFYGIQRLTSI